jgi:hypothetical protein
MAWCVGCSQRGANWPVTRNVQGCLQHMGVLIDNCPSTVHGRPHQSTVNGSQLGSERGGTVGYPYGGAADSPPEALLIAGEGRLRLRGGSAVFCRRLLPVDSTRSAAGRTTGDSGSTEPWSDAVPFGV